MACHNMWLTAFMPIPRLCLRLYKWNTYESKGHWICSSKLFVLAVQFSWVLQKLSMHFDSPMSYYVSNQTFSIFKTVIKFESFNRFIGLSVIVIARDIDRAILMSICWATCFASWFNVGSSEMASHPTRSAILVLQHEHFFHFSCAPSQFFFFF